MRSLSRSLLAHLAVAATALMVSAAWANGDGGGLNAGHAAKVARERAKQDAARSARADDAQERERDGDCGNLEIGNVDVGNRPGRTPREITVVVRGDVINTNNKCR